MTRLLTNASQFPQGTQTGYGNAEALFTMANGLFVVSPALALFPRFPNTPPRVTGPPSRR